MSATTSPDPAATTPTPQAETIVEVGGHDLPVYCPNPAMPLWSGHPRVFLDLTHTGAAACPYCGTRYRLKPGTVLKGH